MVKSSRHILNFDKFIPKSPLSHREYSLDPHMKNYPLFSSLKTIPTTKSINHLKDTSNNYKILYLNSSSITDFSPHYLDKPEYKYNDLLKLKIDFLLRTKTNSNKSPILFISNGFKNNSRLKDKINELIELSYGKTFSPSPKKEQSSNQKDELKSNESNPNLPNKKENHKENNNKTLKEKRKDIYELLIEKPKKKKKKFYSVNHNNKIKNYEKEKLLSSKHQVRELNRIEIKENYHIANIRNHSKKSNDSDSCQKINLFGKMINMKLTNNKMSNNSNVNPSCNNKEYYSPEKPKYKKNFIIKKTRRSYHIDNIIKELEKFKFSNNNNNAKRTIERQNEIKENNLQLIEMIKNKMENNKSSNKKVKEEEEEDKINESYEDIDIKIDEHN